MRSKENGQSRIPGSHPGEPNRIWVALMTSPFQLVPCFFFALYGLLSLVFGGSILPASFGIVATIATVNWLVSVGLGGVLTVIGRINGWDRIEQAGMALMAYGFGLFAGVLVVTMILSHSLGPIAACGLLTSLTIACGIRLYVLHMGVKARKLAGQVQHDREQNGDSPT
jgi:hypothetical protein